MPSDHYVRMLYEEGDCVGWNGCEGLSTATQWWRTDGKPGSDRAPCRRHAGEPVVRRHCRMAVRSSQFGPIQSKAATNFEGAYVPATGLCFTWCWESQVFASFDRAKSAHAAVGRGRLPVFCCRVLFSHCVYYSSGHWERWPDLAIWSWIRGAGWSNGARSKPNALTAEETGTRAKSGGQDGRIESAWLVHAG